MCVVRVSTHCSVIHEIEMTLKLTLSRIAALTVIVLYRLHHHWYVLVHCISNTMPGITQQELVPHNTCG